MVIMDGEGDIMKLWSVVVELSEQLTRTRQLVSSIHNQAVKVKGQAVHSETGFVLRRFNSHLSKEDYDTELERMNAAMSTENLTLQHDNKQLNSLLKEYEQTLDTVMSTFRKRAHDVQERELHLIKQYESLIMGLEATALSEQLSADNSVSNLISQCSRLLRMVLRLLGGEEPEPGTPPEDEEARSAPEEEAVDWALEREIELARLEKENEELRMLLKAGEMAESGDMPLALPKVPLAAIKALMPRRPRPRGHNSFSSESSLGDFQPIPHPDGLQDLRDMDDDTEVF